MKWAPKPYQVAALKFIFQNGGSGIFLDPGMGKTSTTLALISSIKERPVLIVAPIRPMYKVWPDEIRKWDDFSHLKWTILHGEDKDKRLQEVSDIYLINPEGLKWFSYMKGFEKLKPKVLIVDESTKFKDSSTSRFKLLKPHLSKFVRRHILTGEPAPNGYLDLFGQMYIADVGKSLGRFITHYRNQYFYASGYGGYSWVLRQGAKEEIQEAIRPSVMRLAAEDHLDMPELIINDIMIELDENSRRIYTEFEDDFLAEIGNAVVMSTNAAASGSKCRQVANGGVYDETGFAHHIHDTKTVALVDLVEQLQGNPLLCFYEFKHDLERIKRAFPSAPCLTGMSGPKLDRVIDEFNAGAIPVLLAHPASAGHGLNLQGSCHHVCFYGLTWDLDLYHQSYKRVWRQGQSSNRVFVHRILAEKTLDQRVARVLRDKATNQSELLHSLKEDV
jgi:SNF2 family DNA or RNA helicase